MLFVSVPRRNKIIKLFADASLGVSLDLSRSHSLLRFYLIMSKLALPENPSLEL